MLDDITTARLLLRKLAPEDLAPFTAMVSDYEVVKNLARWPFPSNTAMIESFFEQIEHAPQKGFAIEKDGQFAGTIGLGPTVGFMLSRPFWGQGIMTEALTAVQEVGLSQFGMLEGHVFHDNPSSRGVFHKCGWRFMGRGRAYSAARREDVDDLLFGLSKGRLDHVAA